MPRKLAGLLRDAEVVPLEPLVGMSDEEIEAQIAAALDRRPEPGECHSRGGTFVVGAVGSADTPRDLYAS